MKKFLICMTLVLVTCSFTKIPIAAKEGRNDIVGEVYTFDDSDDYTYSKSKKHKLTNDGGKTYGTFFMEGNISNITKDKGINVFEVSSGNVKFSYTYSDQLLKAKESKWHLSEDDGKWIDNIDLDRKIKKGAIVLQTSKDGKNWVNEIVKTNVFEDKPVETKELYTTNDIQLSNGCYYRILVAYELEINKGTKKVLGFIPKDKMEYKKYVEVYNFYVVNEDTRKRQISNNKFSLGSKVKTSKSGFVKEGKIDKDDPHYGWDLGEFFVDGYTANIEEKNGNPVFLKNSGDQVTLWFNLKQDINKLNKQRGLTIYNNSEAYDEKFETPKTDFGRGTLIIRYTNHENVKGKPIIYKNFLEASALMGADTKVKLFDEGDYEVTLDYSIHGDDRLLGFIPKSKYDHYKIEFKFSVRNGNCMAFPFDVKTKEELTNTSITPNGFYLDLAKSRYLDVNIKRQVLKKGAKGLTEDVRFNKPAKDGDEYTKDGIYTVTVKNKYTNQTTEKVIYIGNDDVLKAYVVTGLPISDIQKQIDQGATVNKDGTLNVVKTNNKVDEKPTEAVEIEESKDTTSSSSIIVVLIIGLGAAGIGYVVYKKRKS